MSTTNYQIYYADVILPLATPGLFTYRIPQEMNGALIIGQRVVVQLGKKKLYTAIIFNIHQRQPEGYTVKYILSVVDIKPLLKQLHLQFWEWISTYYMCSMGEVMNAALPSRMKLESESKIMIHRDFEGDISGLNEKEIAIISALYNQQILSLSEVGRIINQQKIVNLIKGLIDRNIIVLEEELKSTYQPKKEMMLKLNAEFQDDEEKLSDTMNQLGKRAFKQLELLMKFLQMSHLKKNTSILKSELISSPSDNAQINVLIKKGIFDKEFRLSSRLKKYEILKSPELIELSTAQTQAYEEINSSFENHKIALLHGVTGSGKTEIYIRLINDCIKQGKQVLYLLPEIGLTTQIINRLRSFFGDKINVYHSRFSNNEKVEIWNRVANEESHQELGEFQIILGARSSIFLPFRNLGLIVVDEEHDSSYKQQNPSPRYHARDAAIVLASYYKANVVLGSATPSFETYYKALNNKFELVKLTERYGNATLPEILAADLKKESRQKSLHNHFSSLLVSYMEQVLKDKKQIILFQNRRGFSLQLECEQCQWTPNCKHCDVSLTYHKGVQKLQCHYCGYSIPLPDICPKCGSRKLHLRGFGTEKIEEILKDNFPSVKVKRMDLDTTRSKNSYQQILNDFEDRKVDILVGTQMVSKGLDFDNVELVGILNADNILSYPDFRSFERAYQQIAQVSGRAGRKDKQGKVIIQTWNPYHQVIRYAMHNQYEELYKEEIADRKAFKYPPFIKMIRITLKHREEDILNDAARIFTNTLHSALNNRVLGPEFPVVSRIRNLYLKNILIKIEPQLNMLEVKEFIRTKASDFSAIKEFKSVRIAIDIDPY